MKPFLSPGPLVAHGGEGYVCDPFLKPSSPFRCAEPEMSLDRLAVVFGYGVRNVNSTIGATYQMPVS